MPSPRALGARPPAARVHGNDWRELDPPSLSFEPTLPISVIVPHYEAQAALELTLTGLQNQTYPSHLVEVVVADDGSAAPPVVPDWAELDVRVVQQERRGFGLARARNLGARNARGTVLVFLDCDMVPEPQFLKAHTRWHHVVSDAVVVGSRRHVDFSGISHQDIARASGGGGLEGLFEGRNIDTPQWLEKHLARTEMMTSGDDDLFRMMSGGNLSLHKELFFGAGAVDETFNQWGGEDNELGYRLYTSGALVIPELEALAWHQGEGHEPDPDEVRSGREQRSKMAHLIADRSFRRQVTGRSYSVPYAVVTMEPGQGSGEDAMVAIESVLANRWHDLVVLMSCSPDYEDFEWLRRQFEGDPRVEVGVGLDGDQLWPAAPVRITIPPETRLAPSAIESMIDELGGKGVGTLHVTIPERDPKEGLVVARTTRSLRRAHRLANEDDEVDEVAGELFGEKWVSGVDYGVKSSRSDATGDSPSAVGTPEKADGARARAHGSRIGVNVEAASDRIARRILTLEQKLASTRDRKVVRAADALGKAFRTASKGHLVEAVRAWRSELARNEASSVDGEQIRKQVEDILHDS